MDGTGRWSASWRRGAMRLALGAGLLGLVLSAVAGNRLGADAQDAATPVLAPLTPGCEGTGFTPALQIVLGVAPGLDGTVAPETLERTREILDRRAARFSPGGCGVWVDGEGRVLVQLATLTPNSGEAVRTLGETARLEIVDTGGDYPAVGAILQTSANAAPASGTPAAGATPSAGAYPAVLTGADITDAYLTQSSSESFQAAITLTDEAVVRFAAFTAAHIGQPLAIVLDGRVISTPVIQAEISGGQVLIEGAFSRAEGEALVIQLQAGALPAALAVLEVATPFGPAPSAPEPDGAATPAAVIGEVAGVESFTVESAQHTVEPVIYAQTPPVGGMHDPQWQTCGFYDAPVRNENAVHTLEHGVVWITYAPDLPSAEVDALRQIAFIDDRLLVSPYPDLDAPVVLSSWDRQLRLDSVDDSRLLDFIAAYAGQSPEPDATCQGGVGTPG